MQLVHRTDSAHTDQKPIALGGPCASPANTIAPQRAERVVRLTANQLVRNHRQKQQIVNQHVKRPAVVRRDLKNRPDPLFCARPNGGEMERVR